MAARKRPTGRDADATTKDATRAALIEAGMALFARDGLDVPSLDAICAEAGFTRGAFYVHFEGREDFIVAVMETATGHFVDAVLSVGGSGLGVAGTIAAFAGAVQGGRFPVFGDVPIHHFLAACARSKELRQRYLGLMLDVRTRLADGVRRDQVSGQLRDDVDPELTAGLLLAVALGVGTMNALAVPFDAEAHAAALTALLSRSSTRRPPRPRKA